LMTGSHQEALSDSLKAISLDPKFMKVCSGGQLGGLF
jgi:hypothetical protein